MKKPGGRPDPHDESRLRKFSAGAMNEDMALACLQLKQRDILPFAIRNDIAQVTPVGGEARLIRGEIGPASDRPNVADF